MGVPAFYKQLISNYKNITLALRQLLRNEQQIFLYIDFNAMIHPCMNTVVTKYINKETINRKIIEVEIFEEIKNELLKIVDKIKPKLLFIATDGVAPTAKMVQQRSRRYKSVFDKKDKRKIFDSNSISPGTPFMNKLSSYLSLFIDQELKHKCKVIYSDHSQVGEGEHKIIKFIKYLQNNNYKDVIHIVNSLDADLIMLTLQFQNENIYLLREKQKYEKNQEVDTDEIDIRYLLLNINKVKEFTWNQLNKDYNFKNIISKERFIKDFIFLCFFIGNDFLPHFKFLNVYDKGIEEIFEQYKKCLKKHKNNLVDDKNNINMSFLVDILKYFSDNEDYFNNKNNKTKYDNIVRYYDQDWKKRYYNHFLRNNNQNTVDNVCFNFCQMLKWTTKYYFEGTKNWSLFYKYRCSPCVSDLYKYLQNNDINKIKIYEDKPVTMNQQLMIILPPQSSYLIPRKYNYLMFSRLKHMYPTKYRLEKVDKKYPWMFTPILPDINIRLIKELIK